MKKQSKEDRKKLIIETTKEMILEQGLKDVSARKIGDRCGLSFATTYNYFRDLNDLFAHVAVELLQDSFNAVHHFDNDALSPKQRIIELAENYYMHMVENTNRFKIIFVQDFGKITTDMAFKLVPKVGLLLGGLIDQIEKDKLVLSKEVTFDVLTASMHARLMFQVFNRTAMTIEDDIRAIKQEIDSLILD